jgi:uncharacterized membrane protein YfcA
MFNIPLYELIPLLLLGGFVAGIVDALAGGGGLIALPILIWTGLPPTTALGTNKLQACMGEATTMLHFIHAGYLNLRELKLGMAVIFISSIIGALTVQSLHNDILYKIMPFIMAFVLIYLVFLPWLTHFHLKQPVNKIIFYTVVGISIGFYNGFFGPGTGSFLIFAYLALQCFTLQNAAIHSKPLNLVANSAALLLFIVNGNVAYLPALTMGTGQIVGAKLGAKLVILQGNRLIRPLFLGVVGCITIKMFWQAYV